MKYNYIIGYQQVSLKGKARFGEFSVPIVWEPVIPLTAIVDELSGYSFGCQGVSDHFWFAFNLAYFSEDVNFCKSGSLPYPEGSKVDIIITKVSMWEGEWDFGWMPLSGKIRPYIRRRPLSMWSFSKSTFFSSSTVHVFFTFINPFATI